MSSFKESLHDSREPLAICAKVAQSQRQDRPGRHRTRDAWQREENRGGRLRAYPNEFSTLLVRVRFLEVLQDLVEFLPESLLGVDDLLCEILW